MGKEQLEEMEAHQYKDIYDVEDAPLEDVSQDVARSLVYFGLVFTVVLVVLSFVICIPREVNVAFELRGGAKEFTWQYTHEVQVLDKYVETGDEVHTGDSLFRITSPEVADHIQLLRSVQRKRALFEIHDYRIHLGGLKLLQRKIGVVKDYIRHTQRKIVATQEAQQISEFNQRRKIELTKNQYARDSILYAQKTISLSELELSEGNVRQVESDLGVLLESSGFQLISLESNLQAYEIELQDAQIAYDQQVLRFEAKRQQLLSDSAQIVENARLDYGEHSVSGNGLIILADCEGTVSMMHESNARITVGQILAKVETASEPFYAYLEVQSKDVGQLETGQQAVLKFSSFPHYYYGTMKAELATVSTSPNAAGHFLVRADILDKGKLGDQVTQGMTGEVSIILEDKTVFDHLFRVFLEKTSFD